MTKRIIAAALAAFICIPLFCAEYDQASTMSVMGKKTEADISFSIDDADDQSLLLCIREFSYKDKTVGDFSLRLVSEDGGKTYKARNVVVRSAPTSSGEDGKSITVAECSVEYKDTGRSGTPVLFLKYKPGKMPFAITLERSK